MSHIYLLALYIFRKWRMCVCVCLWLCMFWAAAWMRLCKMYRQICKYDPVGVWTCTFVLVLTRAFEGVSQIATFISVLWLFSKWAAGSRRAWQQADVQATFWQREDIHSGRHAWGLRRMWSSVPPPSIQRRWVPWDEGTYSIPTMLIRDVTLCEEKTRVEIRSHFSRLFPRRHLAV